MADETRVYFESQAERNKYFLENKSDYVIGETISTTPGQGKTYFVEKKELTTSEAQSLGYGKGGSQTVSGSAGYSALRESGRLKPQEDTTMSGTPEAAAQKISEKYASGEYDPAYSARIESAGAGKQKISFYKTPKGQESAIYYRQDTQVMAGAAPPGDQGYIYRTIVETPEQARDIEAWAEQSGAKVKRVYGSNETEARQMAKEGITLEITSASELPENLEVPVRSYEIIRRERAEKMAKIAGQKLYEGSTPLEQAALHTHTLLSVKGYEYVGAAVMEQLEGSPPLSPGFWAKMGLSALFPKIKSTKEVVVENLSDKIFQGAMEEYTVTFSLPLVGKVDVDRKILDVVSNPVVDVEMMALGGSGVAKVGATKVGAKVLGSTAAKAAMGVGAAAFYGSRGYEIVTLKSQGKDTEALGKLITTAAGTAAGALAYKAELAHIIKTKTPEIEISAVKGGSATKQSGDESVSVGKFKVTEGKLKGLEGYTYSKTKGDKGGVIIKIPEQKIGKLKIEAQTIVRQSDIGQPLDIKGIKIYHTTTKEGRIFVNDKSGALVGRNQEETYMRETARIMASTADKTGKSSNLVIRKLTGYSTGKTAKEYNLLLVSKGEQMVAIESKLIGSKALAKVDWVDISRLGDAKSGFVRIIKPTGTVSGASAASAAKTVTAVKPVSVPPLGIAVKVTPDVSLGARIVPVVNPVPVDLRIKRKDEEKTVQLKKTGPQIYRPESASDSAEKALKSIGGTQLAQATNISIKTPSIIKATESARLSYQGLTPAYHPITGQAIDEALAKKLEQKLEPIIDRIASQPVPTIPVQPNKVKAPKLPYLVPFLRLGTANIKALKFKTGVLKNPVPDIRKVI